MLPLPNDFARVPVRGLVAGYNWTELPPGPDRIPALMRSVPTRCPTLRGFIVRDFADTAPDVLRDVGGWLRGGRVRHQEDVVEGVENAPDAFIGMLRGRNLGKLAVEVA